MTHLFFVPHTDDETIGMAGSIVRAIDNGHTVQIVLVTDNLPSDGMKGQFPNHVDQLERIRIQEFEAALLCLGVVAAPHYLMLREELIANSFSTAVFWLTISMHLYLRGEHGQVVIHTTMGAGDPHAQLGRGNRSHAACEAALRNVKQSRPDIEAILHRIYVYSQPIEMRVGPFIHMLNGYETERKLRAIDAYKPGATIGYGWRSVSDLFHAAATDHREYSEVL